MRTTKTVWPFRARKGALDFGELADARGPGLSDSSSTCSGGVSRSRHTARRWSRARENARCGLEAMRDVFGEYPTSTRTTRTIARTSTGARHASTTDRRARFIDAIPGHVPFDGHVEGSPYWWGDVARGRIRYVRNLTFDALDVTRINPTMPYVDPKGHW